MEQATIEITEEQAQRQFSMAVAEWCGDNPATIDDWAQISPEEVAITRDTMEDFVDRRLRGGPPETIQTQFGTLLRWESVQQAKGKRRGDLLVIDFGNLRAAHFDGEV